jgi:O-antigen/teichoic acid export membrane protein
MIARLRSANLARLCSLVDQGAQGVANILATSALGRNLPSDQFGAIGVAIGIYYFVAGFHRSAVVLPYITEHEVPASAAGARRYHSDWWWFNLIAALALSGVLVVLALALEMMRVGEPAWSWGITPLLLGAMITPPLLCAEQTRRWLYKIGRADMVALVSVFSAGILVATAFAAPLIRASALTGALAWVASGVFGTLVTLLVLRPSALSLTRSLNCFSRHRDFATWLALTILPYVFYSSATVVILIGIFDGPLAAAVFTAARTLTNPAVSFVSAIDSIDKPRAAYALATQGMKGLRQSVRRTRLLLIMVTGLYLSVVAVFAQPLLDLAFHHRYSGITLEVRLLAAAFFLFCLNQPSETLLIVLRASRTMFVTRSATAILTLGLLFAGSGRGVAGMAIGMAVAQGANLLFLLIAERWVERRWTPAMVPA